MIDDKKFAEIDDKIDEEVKKINLVEWVISMLTIGILWATYEKKGKPVTPGLAMLTSLVKINKEHAYGRRKPSGALAAVEDISEILPFGRAERKLLDLSLISAGENLKQISDTAKMEIRKVLIDSQVSGMKPRELERRLRETFTGIDRDWRKVAVTESATTALNGYLLTHDEGQKVVMQSAVDCCDWCRSMLHGKVFTVLHEEPSDPKLWETSLWPGKNNVGRSRHKNARGGSKRSADQLWTPCCPLHPHCRCRPVAFSPKLQEIGKDGFVAIKGAK